MIDYCHKIQWIDLIIWYYGNTFLVQVKRLRQMDNNRENTYEELIQLKENGEIGWREFIRRQPEMENDYYDWCIENDLDMNEETAEAFMTLTEEHVMA